MAGSAVTPLLSRVTLERFPPAPLPTCQRGQYFNVFSVSFQLGSPCPCFVEGRPL